MERKHWTILLVLMSVEVVASLESGMVIAGIPRWVQIHGDAVQVGWLLSSYLIVQAAAAVLGGRLGDMFGRRRVALIALAMCVFGSLISGLAPTLSLMIVGRAIQGAAGCLQPLLYGLVREHLPENRMRFAISMIVATASGAAAVGMVLGGALTDRFGPQTIFVAMAFTATLAWILAFTMLPRGSVPPRPERIDVLGGVLFVPGMIVLLMGVSALESGGIARQTALQIGIGLAILAGWAIYEARQSQPMVNVRLLGKRDIALAMTAMALSSLGLMQMSLVISMLLQQPEWSGIGLGNSATLVGALNFPPLIAGMIGSLVVGRVADRYGPRLPMIVGALIGIVAELLLMFWHDSTHVLVAILVLTSLGAVIVYTAVPMVVVAVAPPDRTSESTGFIGVTRGLFRAIGTQVVGLLLMSSTISIPGNKPLPDENAYILVFAFAAALTFGTLLAALGISRRPGTMTAAPA